MEPEVNRPLTTRDVAAAAGVNQSTVSRALRGDPKIRPEVRERILKHAKDLGYRPNPFVSAFTAQVRSYRRSPKGAVLAILDCNPQGIPDRSAYLRGANQRAREHGFQPEVLFLHEIDFSFERLNKLLWTRAISGLLVLPVPLGFDLSEINFDHLASASVDTTVHSPAMHRAETDYFQGMQLAIRVLESRGYKRISFCTTQHEVSLLDEEWLGGFAGWQALKPEPLRMLPYIGENWDDEPFKRWFKTHRPDAIICNTHKFFRLCHEMGFNTDKVANITLNAGSDYPKMAGISQNQESVGAAAVDMILAQIHRNDYGLPKMRKKILIQSTWVDGETVRREEPAKLKKALPLRRKVQIV